MATWSTNPEGDLALLRWGNGAFAEGTPLTQAIQEGWPRHRYVELGAQIAQEVATAHARGEVFGTLQPRCVSLNLADYPVVAPTQEPPPAAWLAPECGHAPATVRTDVFGIGGLLYFIFAGNDPPATCEERRAGLAACPGDVAAIVLGCLEPDPQRRFASADDIVHALMSCSLHDPTPDRSWHNPFWENADESGARPVLRSTTPPRSPTTAPPPDDSANDVADDNGRFRHGVIAVGVALAAAVVALAWVL